MISEQEMEVLMAYNYLDAIDHPPEPSEVVRQIRKRCGYKPSNYRPKDIPPELLMRHRRAYLNAVSIVARDIIDKSILGGSP